MEEINNQNYSFPSSFYDKYIQDDENMQARIKPILNQIHESRVLVKELHTEYGVRFSEMISSYCNRLNDLEVRFENLVSELHAREKVIYEKCNELLKSENK